MSSNGRLHKEKVAPPKRRNACYMPKEKLDLQLLTTTWISLEDVILREIRWS